MNTYQVQEPSFLTSWQNSFSFWSTDLQKFPRSLSWSSLVFSHLAFPIAAHLRFFFYCYDKILRKKQWEVLKVCSGSQFKSTVHCGGEIKTGGTRTNCLHHIHNQEAENSSTLLLVPFHSVLDPRQERYLCSVWVLLPLLMQSGPPPPRPRRHAQMPGFQVFLGSVRLTH